VAWTLIESADYRKTLPVALGRFGARKTKIALRLNALMDRLGEKGPQSLARKAWKPEGYVKDGHGRQKQFHAIAHGQIRIYAVHEGDEVLLSHAVYKDQEKLDASDTARVQDNYRSWKR